MSIYLNLRGILSDVENSAAKSVFEFLKAEERIIPGRDTGIIIEDETMIIDIYPSEEPVFLTFQDKCIYCRARTNSAGPGYHAYLIDLLDRIADSVGINWMYDDNSEGYGDESGYAVNRDFSALKKQMLHWFNATVDIILERSTKENLNTLSINMPLSMTPAEQYFVAHPLGYLNKEWFIKYLRTPYKKKEKLAEDFFPWWNKGRNGRFYYKAAMTLMWCQCSWHTPYNKSELDLYSTICTCLEKAYETVSEPNFPYAEWIEIETYLGRFDKADRIRQMAGGNIGIPTIGFKRGNINRMFNGGWRVKMPGDMYCVTEGGSETCWSRNRTIKLTSYDLDEEVDDRYIAEMSEALRAEGYISFEQMVQKCVFSMVKVDRLYEDGQSFNLLSCYVLTDNKMATLKVYFSDDGDIDWAVDVISSLTHNKGDYDGEGQNIIEIAEGSNL